MFDPEAYNYVFNRKTAFLDGELTRINHYQLNYVLQNMNRIDVDMLELLHYTSEIPDGKDEEGNTITKKNSALHIAVQEGNSLCCEVLLKYLTIIKFNASRSFKDIFSELIQYN